MTTETSVIPKVIRSDIYSVPHQEDNLIISGTWMKFHKLYFSPIRTGILPTSVDPFDVGVNQLMPTDGVELQQILSEFEASHPLTIRSAVLLNLLLSDCFLDLPDVWIEYRISTTVPATLQEKISQLAFEQIGLGREVFSSRWVPAQQDNHAEVLEHLRQQPGFLTSEGKGEVDTRNPQFSGWMPQPNLVMEIS